MVNKKGYLRTLEAIIAVILIFSLIIYLNQKSPNLITKKPNIIEESQKIILQQISSNETLKNCALSFDSNSGNNCKHKPSYNQTLNCDYIRSIVISGECACNEGQGEACHDYEGKACSVDEECPDGYCDLLTQDTSKSAIDWIIFDNAPKQYLYECEICSSPLSCLNDQTSGNIPNDKSVFTDTIFLTNGITLKVVRLYFWES